MVSVAWLRAELVQGTTCNKDQLCTGYKPGKSGYVVQLHVQSSIPITEKFSAQDVSKKTRRGTKEIGSNFFQFVFVEKVENLGVANLCCSANAVLGAEVLREACRGTLGGGLPGMTAGKGAVK